MALSASVNFSLSRDNLITMALQHIGALGDGETPSTTQLTECSLLLNTLIKSWMPDRDQLWMTYYGYILPVSGVTKTSIGTEGGHAVSSYVHTTTSAASSSGGSTVTLTSVTGVATTYNIGVEQSNGTMQWTTVNGAPAGSVVTLTAVLTGNVASGADVYIYQTANKLTRPFQIADAFRRTASVLNDTPLNIISMQEYNNLSDKTETGIVNQIAYDKVLGFSSSGYPGNGDLYYWPIFQNGDNLIVIKYVKIYDDFDSAGDNPEFPQHWFLPIMLGLAWLLGPKNGITLKERQMLLQEATMMKQMALGGDVEDVSTYFQPNNRMNWSK